MMGRNAVIVAGNWLKRGGEALDLRTRLEAIAGDAEEVGMVREAAARVVAELPCSDRGYHGV